LAKNIKKTIRVTWIKPDNETLLVNNYHSVNIESERREYIKSKCCCGVGHSYGEYRKWGCSNWASNNELVKPHGYKYLFNSTLLKLCFKVSWNYPKQTLAAKLARWSLSVTTWIQF
jgi:hypothetical protein